VLRHLNAPSLRRSAAWRGCTAESQRSAPPKRGRAAGSLRRRDPARRRTYTATSGLARIIRAQACPSARRAAPPSGSLPGVIPAPHSRGGNLLGRGRLSLLLDLDAPSAGSPRPCPAPREASRAAAAHPSRAWNPLPRRRWSIDQDLAQPPAVPLGTLPG